MASRFVVCKDKEEAQRMADAGLLYLSWLSDGSGNHLYEGGSQDDERYALYYYGTSAWPVDDFAYLVEEDDNPNEDDACGWDRLLSDWKRRGSAGGWESYVLVEDDTEEVTCPSP